MLPCWHEGGHGGSRSKLHHCFCPGNQADVPFSSAAIMESSLQPLANELLHERLTWHKNLPKARGTVRVSWLRVTKSASL